jgi:hypothetical protein
MPDFRMTTRRALLIAAILIAAFFAVRAIGRALASDETKIRWLLADEAAAFNDCSMLSVLDHFAPDWQDETTGVSRQALKGGLLYVFQNRRDPKTQRFLYRVEVGETDIDVQGERATAKFPLVLHEGIDAAEKPIWELKVTADLGKHEGSWRIDRSRHETVHGSAPR